MFNIDIIYILINLLLLGTFIYSGQQIGRGHSYHKYSIVCIIVFTLVLGLRYGRGFDYFHYVDIYCYGYHEGRQLVFTWINDCLKWLGVGKYAFFLFYSFIEILCAMFFLKRYKEYSQYLLPIFLIAIIVFDEFQIRQALGFSFGFLCLDSLYKTRIYGINKHISINTIINGIKQIGRPILFFIIAYSIHSACGYILIIMIVIYFLYQRTIPLIFSIPVLLISTFFSSEWFDYSWLNPILSQFTENDNRMNMYVEHSEKWFSSAGMDERYLRRPIVLFAEMLGTISLYILGKKVINQFYKKKDAFALYNYFVLGTIVLNLFRTLELLFRIGRDFAIFWFFPLTLVLYHRKKIIHSFFDKVLFVFLLWWVYDYLKYLFMRGNMTLFVWDI